MTTKQFKPEILIAGFAHLLWITLLALWMLGKSPDIVICFFSNITSGTAILIGSLIIGISFFLGVLAEHFLIIISYWFMNDENKNKQIAKFKPDEAWQSKSFFRSMFFASACIIILLIIMVPKVNFNNEWWQYFPLE
jgi:hypothetical protein